MQVGGRLIKGGLVTTSLSRRLEPVMHRRSDGSKYDVAGLTERMIFENMEISVPKTNLGSEKLSLPLNHFNVPVAIL